MNNLVTANQTAVNTLDRLRVQVDRAIQGGLKGLQQSGRKTELGVTPKELVYKRGTANLYHYTPVTDEVYRVPILLVMATTNRGYIFDLYPGQSLVEFLLSKGFDVYMLDWTAPKMEEKDLRLEDYALRFIDECIESIQSRSGESEVTLLGYCMGGVLSVIHTALSTPGRIKNLVAVTTPIDFSGMKLFRSWADPRFMDIDQMVDSMGIIPASVISQQFKLTRPASEIASTIRLWDNMWNDEYVKSYKSMERWMKEQLPLAGQYARETVKEILQGNRLFLNELTVRGRRVDLTKIKVPVLSIIAEHDHLVPYDVAKPLIATISSKDKEELIVKGGHVSVIAGPGAVKRVWPKLNEWLQERST
jgi:polyhydroxyalkanoate synthase